MAEPTTLATVTDRSLFSLHPEDWVTQRDSHWEYSYLDLQQPDLRLGRLVDGRYEWVAPDVEGRLWSEQLGVGFVWRAGERFVRLVGPDQTVVPTPREEEALRKVAEERAERELRRADQAARRAERESRRRVEAEQRAHELAVEVERLRRRLADGERRAAVRLSRVSGSPPTPHA